MPWREFLESSFTLRFCWLAVDLAGRLLPELAPEVGTEGEAGVGVDWLPAFSYSVIRAPFRRFVPCSCREGVGDRLGEVLVRSGLALPVGDGEVEVEREVDPAAAAKAACLPACLILLVSAFVGRTIRPFLVLGRAGQLSRHSKSFRKFSSILVNCIKPIDQSKLPEPFQALPSCPRQLVVELVNPALS